jgi:hypothetical protein
MYKYQRILLTALIVFAVAAVAAIADGGGNPEKTDAFVCPVLGGKAGEEHGNASPKPLVEIGGGDYTVGGPDIRVPVHATNDNGAGTPTGDHTSPGDRDYTAIWAAQ